MAIYVPASRRRRRALAVALVALVVGGAGGLAVGRMTAPTVPERVHAIQRRGTDIAAELQVLALHADAGTAAQGAADSAMLVLARVRRDLDAALRDAPWISARTRAALERSIDELDRAARGGGDATPAFGARAAAVAAQITAALGGEEHSTSPAGTGTPSG